MIERRGLVPEMNCVAPTEVTYGMVAGKEAWNSLHPKQPVPSRPRQSCLAQLM